MRTSVSTARTIGRASGIAGGLVAVALWGRFLANVVIRPEDGGSPAVAAAMILLAALAIVAAWFESPLGLLVAFVLSFVPVGLYLLMTPSVYAGIGMANLLYLVAALALLAARRTHTGAAPR